MDGTNPEHARQLGSTTPQRQQSLPIHLNVLTGSSVYAQPIYAAPLHEESPQPHSDASDGSSSTCFCPGIDFNSFTAMTEPSLEQFGPRSPLPRIAAMSPLSVRSLEYIDQSASQSHPSASLSGMTVNVRVPIELVSCFFYTVRRFLTHFM